MKLLKEQLMKISKTLVFDIKRFAIHDGSGLRTTVFFKGCLFSMLVFFIVEEMA